MFNHVDRQTHAKSVGVIRTKENTPSGINSWPTADGIYSESYFASVRTDVAVLLMRVLTLSPFYPPSLYKALDYITYIVLQNKGCRTNQERRCSTHGNGTKQLRLLARAHSTACDRRQLMHENTQRIT